MSTPFHCINRKVLRYIYKKYLGGDSIEEIQLGLWYNLNIILTMDEINNIITDINILTI